MRIVVGNNQTQAPIDLVLYPMNTLIVLLFSFVIQTIANVERLKSINFIYIS